MPRLVYLKLMPDAPVDSIPVSIPKVKGDDGKTVPKGGKPQSVRFSRSETGALYELHEAQIAHLQMVANSDRLVGPVPSETIHHEDGSITVQRKPEWDAKSLARKIKHHEDRILETTDEREIANRHKKIATFEALMSSHARVRMADVAFVLPAKNVMVEVVPVPDPAVEPAPPPATTPAEPTVPPPPPASTGD